MRAAQANLDRLRVLEQYKRILAPFDGLVTTRTTDVGALINAGAGGGPPLFVVSETRKLRVYVNVPQNYVPNIPVGIKAKIAVPEYPAKAFQRPSRLPPSRSIRPPTPRACSWSSTTAATS